MTGSWVFVGADDGYLYGLDRRTGSLRWKSYVVDDESLEAAREDAAAAARMSAHKEETSDMDEQERREWKEYEAVWNTSGKDDVKDDGDTAAETSTPGLCAWAAAGRLFRLTRQGFLSCFELAEAAPDAEVSP